MLTSLYISNKPTIVLSVKYLTKEENIQSNDLNKTNTLRLLINIGPNGSTTLIGLFLRRLSSSRSSVSRSMRDRFVVSTGAGEPGAPLSGARHTAVWTRLFHWWRGGNTGPTPWAEGAVTHVLSVASPAAARLLHEAAVVRLVAFLFEPLRLLLHTFLYFQDGRRFIRVLWVGRELATAAERRCWGLGYWPKWLAASCSDGDVPTLPQHTHAPARLETPPRRNPVRPSTRKALAGPVRPDDQPSTAFTTVAPGIRRHLWLLDINILDLKITISASLRTACDQVVERRHRKHPLNE